MTVEEFDPKAAFYKYNETLAVVDRLMRNQDGFFDHVYHALFTCYEPRKEQSFSCASPFVIAHNWGVPGSPAAQPIPQLQFPWVKNIIKRDASAFKPAPNHTSLHEELQANGVDTLYVAGILTDYCIEATVMDGLDLGYTVYTVSDACTTTNGAVGQQKGLQAIETFFAWHWPGSKVITSSEIDQPPAVGKIGSVMV